MTVDSLTDDWVEAARLLLREPGTDANDLYTRWFHRETQSMLSWPGEAAYRAATLDARALQPGWRTVQDWPAMAGAVIAQRGGHQRLVAPPEMAPTAAAGMMPGRGAELLVHPLTSALSDGFWHLWSAGWQRASPRRLQRVYIEVHPQHALTLASRVARAAPWRPIWALKMLCGEHDAGRRDRAVLYLPHDCPLATKWVAAILQAAEALSLDDLPPFVQRLGLGIGQAPDPGGGRSFGQAVCDALAGAVALADDPVAFEIAATAAVRAIPAQAVDAAMAAEALPAIGLPLTPVPALTLGAAVQDWHSAALTLARDIAAGAVSADGHCTFHGATTPHAVGSPPRFRSMGSDVYEGTAGIARFLGHAAASSGDPLLAETALAALQHALAHIEGWALFTGGMGVGLVALEVAELLQQPALVAPALQAIEASSSAALAEGAPQDLLVGTAGVIVGLVAARRYDLDGGWAARAQELGRGLLAAAVDDGPAGEDGPPLSWRLGSGIAARLCGLAHGASGIAMAFEALGRVDPQNPVWRRAARQARTYERAHYSRDVGSWSDLRPPDQGTTVPGCPHMWCHGSIGIGAERLAAIGHDLMARADAAGALAGARAHALRLLQGPVGPGAGDEVNASVCHGVSGLVDLFIDAWQVSGDTAWMALAERLCSLMRNDATRVGGWRSGVPGGWPAPGLMLGKAGAGWALLRLAQPTRIPSVWRLGPPSSDLATGVVSTAHPMHA